MLFCLVIVMEACYVYCRQNCSSEIDDAKRVVEYRAVLEGKLREIVARAEAKGTTVCDDHYCNRCTYALRALANKLRSKNIEDIILRELPPGLLDIQGQSTNRVLGAHERRTFSKHMCR